MDARWDIVVESFREGQFLLARFVEAFDAPRMTLPEVAEGIEDRLLGACEGVRLGGASAIDALLLPALTGRQPRGVTLATILLAQLGAPGIDAAIAALEENRVALPDAFGRGLALTQAADARARLVRRIHGMAPAVQAAIVDAHATGPMPPAIALERRVDVSSSAVCRACLRLAARWRPAWAPTWAQWGMPRSDARIRVLATKLALQLDLRGASGPALELAQQGAPGSSELLTMLAMRYGERVLPSIASDLQRGHDVLDALACVGTRSAVDLCVAALERDELARRAAATIATITGIDVPAARHDPFARALRGAEALLPWPDVEALRARWSSLRDAMPAGVRHLAGRRFDERVSFDALAHGPMRARHLLATELELRTEGRAQLDTRTWTAIQRAQLQPHVAARAA